VKKQGILLTSALILIVISVIVFFYNNIIIPGVRHEQEKKVRAEIDDNAMPKVKVAVVADEEGIAKYTVINDKVMNGKIELIDVPVKYLARNAATSMEQLAGKITKEDLRKGEQIVLDSLSTDKKWFGEYERLKEYFVNNIVAGEVKTGNIIDIIVNYGNGSYDVVAPKIKVRKLVEEQGSLHTSQKEGEAVSENLNDDKSKNYTLIFAVDEEQYRDLELASKLGKLETRLYLDESQPSSIKTFDYNKAVKKLGIQGEVIPGSVNSTSKTSSGDTASQPEFKLKN